ncbi:hypothetical protein CMsap09_12515 [Clavibacter michiganensis]|uniref:Uncharacterized protein n=1 Tax=Clavibacter michiganensis TaxID=28447 RepID=A0A251XWY7_9MICO|nr:hypothetical protein CMsap09_12515 [Clavibacter michiganensis]
MPVAVRAPVTRGRIRRHQQDPRPVAEERHQREGVEDLVEAEAARPRVRPLQRVDDGADRVGEAAREDERHHRGVGAEEVDDEDERRVPEHQVEEHVEPPRGADPQHAEQHAEDRARPHQPEQQHRLPVRQGQHGDGRVGAGDEQEDVRVVHALQEDLRARRPVEPVVDGRDAEQQQRRRHEHGAGDAGGGAVGHRDEDDAEHERHRGHARVQPAAPGGPGLGPRVLRVLDEREVRDGAVLLGARRFGPLVRGAERSGGGGGGRHPASVGQPR